MKKLKLDVADLRVASFEPDESQAVHAITGTPCLTRQTVYETCCSPG